MKILFVGNTNRTALALHYFTNFVRMGNLVLPFDPQVFRTQTPWERLKVRLTKRPLNRRIQEVTRELTSLCQQNRFDLLFVMAENYLSEELIENLRKLRTPRPSLVYHSHDNNFAPGILKPENLFSTLKLYDLVFTTKSQNVIPYQKLGISQTHFIASAYEPSVHHPIESDYSVYGDKSFPVTFLGTYDESRIKFLESVGWELLTVWGDHWKRYEQFQKYSERIHPRAIYDFEFADVTSHSKLSLGLLREEAQDLHTTRTFEIPACGSCQLAPRNDEILSFFEEDKEIVCFQTPEELRDKVTFYLSHELVRRKIAEQGLERLRTLKATYYDRIKEMLKHLNDLRSFPKRSLPSSSSLETTEQLELTEL